MVFRPANWTRAIDRLFSLQLSLILSNSEEAITQQRNKPAQCLVIMCNAKENVVRKPELATWPK